MIETIGKRIAFLRQKNNWTQQSLANQLAMSRVAISHIEMDLTIPSERSITLMAGIFKLSPVDLVDGTTYPRAKAERLPEQTAIYTQLELDLALFINDTDWLSRLDDPRDILTYINEIRLKWSAHIAEWNKPYLDKREKDILLMMKQIYDEIKN